MKIKRHKPKDIYTERQIVTSMIVSEDVCRNIQHMYKTRWFQTKITREVSKWCMEFFKEYESAIKQDIKSVFEMKTKAGEIDPDLGDEIEKFLLDISKEYEGDEEENNPTFNTQFYVELARKYFKKRSYIIFSEEINQAVENNDVELADKIYSKYTTIQEQQDKSRSILDDSGIDKYKLSLETVKPYLFTMPGSLGKLMGPITRGSFIGILAREKAGKTHHLGMFAKAAAKNKLTVGMIETGDLTHDQLDTRFYCSLTGKVASEDKVGTYQVPVLDCLLNQMGDCDKAPSEKVVQWNEQLKRYEYTIDVKNLRNLKAHEPCIECYKDRKKRKKFQGSVWWERKKIEKWTWGELRRKTEEFKRRFRGKIITEAFPMKTFSVTQLRDWVIYKFKKGEPIDLLLVDYPDIMNSDNIRTEFRHKENEKWMDLRGISQEFGICVIVVTQADAKSFNRDTLKLDNYSEDKRKYGHTTHFYAINKTKEEEEMMCSRFAALVLRDDFVKISRQVTILSEYPTSRIYKGSFFGRMPNLIT